MLVATHFRFLNPNQRSGTLNYGHDNYRRSKYGFLELTQPLMDTPIKVVGSRLILDAGRRPQISDAQVDALARESAVIH